MKAKVLSILFFIFSFASKAQKLENFSLKSVTNKDIFTLSKANGKFVALHFLLKTECPYCIRHTNEYFERSASLPNVIQVFIKPDSEDEIKAWASKLSSDNSNVFPIYQDLNSELAKKLKIPYGYQFHGQVVHFPAMILVNKNGEEIFRYIGKNNSDRFSFDNLKLKIEALNNE